jgi:hypothetical protein
LGRITARGRVIGAESRDPFHQWRCRSGRITARRRVIGEVSRTTTSLLSEAESLGPVHGASARDRRENQTDTARRESLAGSNERDCVANGRKDHSETPVGAAARATTRGLRCWTPACYSVHPKILTSPNATLGTVSEARHRSRTIDHSVVKRVA